MQCWHRPLGQLWALYLPLFRIYSHSYAVNVIRTLQTFIILIPTLAEGIGKKPNLRKIGTCSWSVGNSGAWKFRAGGIAPMQNMFMRQIELLIIECTVTRFKCPNYATKMMIQYWGFSRHLTVPLCACVELMVMCRNAACIFLVHQIKV